MSARRALRAMSRLADLYWLTHLYLLDTRYLRAAPKNPNVFSVTAGCWALHAPLSATSSV